MAAKPAEESERPLQITVANDEELESKLAEPGMKGPCMAVIEDFKGMRQRWEERGDELQFLKVEADNCELIAEVKAHAMRCEPKFLIYQNGQLKHNIDGANVPAIQDAVKSYLQPLLPPLKFEGMPAEVNPFAVAIAARAPQPEPEPQISFQQLADAFPSAGTATGAVERVIV